MKINGREYLSAANDCERQLDTVNELVGTCTKAQSKLTCAAIGGVDVLVDDTDQCAKSADAFNTLHQDFNGVYSEKGQLHNSEVP